MKHLRIFGLGLLLLGIVAEPGVVGAQARRPAAPLPARTQERPGNLAR